VNRETSAEFRPRGPLLWCMVKQEGKRHWEVSLRNGPLFVKRSLNPRVAAAKVFVSEGNTKERWGTAEYWSEKKRRVRAIWRGPSPRVRLQVRRGWGEETRVRRANRYMSVRKPKLGRDLTALEKKSPSKLAGRLRN